VTLFFLSFIYLCPNFIYGRKTKSQEKIKKSEHEKKRSGE